MAPLVGLVPTWGSAYIAKAFITVISGGRLLRENLDLLGKSEAWVRESLSAYNCEIRDVFLLTCEPGGKLYLSIREDAT